MTGEFLSNSTSKLHLLSIPAGQYEPELSLASELLEEIRSSSSHIDSPTETKPTSASQNARMIIASYEAETLSSRRKVKVHVAGMRLELASLKLKNGYEYESKLLTYDSLDIVLCRLHEICALDMDKSLKKKHR